MEPGLAPAERCLNQRCQRGCEQSLMCGFVAIIGPGAPVNEALLTYMRDRLTHRGPDGAANWSRAYPNGSVSLGFRRLAVIDTRHVADQPMVSEDGQKVIVFNGEIYNYVELRSELERIGRRFRTRSDTEVLMQAYEQWGDDMIPRLNGMFAFVIWDAALGEALIVRDRFGEKPLYWACLPDGGMIFASELKALTAHPDLDAPIDRAMMGRVLAGFLLFGVDETLFRGIRMFKAAHKMRLGPDGAKRGFGRYWQPSYGRELDTLPRSSVQEGFRSHLERAVAQRMRADVRLTACLSGGLDSSTLVALMAPRGLESTISARFPDDPTIDEGAFIDRVLNISGVSGQSVSPTPAALVSDLRQLHWHHETIIPGASMYLEWAVMREARRSGYTVIIDGQGADELLAGYQIFFQAWQAETFRRGNIPQALVYGWLRDRRLAGAATGYEQANRRFAQRDSLTWDQLRAFHGNHVRDTLNAYGAGYLPAPEEVGALRFELAVNMLRTSLPLNLFSGDRNSMAHGIECRYPFLDYELVDYANQLPDWAYIGRGWGKYVLRRAFPDKLPADIRWRADKVGFVAPQDRWIHDSALSAWVEERVMDRSLADIDGYDRSRIETWWQEHINQTADNSDVLWRWASAAELLDMEKQGMWTYG